MFKYIYTLLILVCFFFPASAQNFISVEGQTFKKNGAVYEYIGANYWYGMYLGANEKGQKRLQEELDQLTAKGVKNLRIMAAFEGDENDLWRVAPGVQSKPGLYNEELLKGLDFLLNELAKRDMTAVLCLNNFWLWSGGMAQYVEWTSGKEIPTPTPYDGSAYPAYTKYTASFYSNEKAIDLFEGYLKSIVLRTNTINGLAYREDPVIMSWQLANEPRGMNNVEAYRKWIGRTAALIKSLDDNHLVSIGSEGNTSTPKPNGLNFRADHQIEGIDYCTFHLWVQNWAWFDPLNAKKSYPKAIRKAKKYLKEHIKIANELNMPLVLEEFGISRDNNDHSIEANTLYRDSYYEFIFKSCYKSAKRGGPLVGCNFWAYGGKGRPSSPKSVWKTGDDLIGDPPHEFQGWYSVYDTDSSTLELIENYAQKINSLNEDR